MAACVGRVRTVSQSRRRLCLIPLLMLLAAAANDAGTPRYTTANDLVVPADYREWVFLSAGLDMSYTESKAPRQHSVFDNVFVDRAAWTAFKQTGHWPDKTVFVMENRGAGAHESINQQGFFQTEDFQGLEFHVRDEKRFAGGWAFFVSNGTQPATQLPKSAACYACHEANGAVDSTFTQFYPTAKPIAVKAGTFRTAHAN